ncbi:Oidioi.mRNA.OKI2018_I69.PAR.g8947.t1.cds [Oikopleura dioica]|uniref:Oidioi.mRNA.OKI2018_I69.PAR.g8947.t1.cds n=1 Tax=Oikopleura dioica TaxID=34765 RepID=A0ABN7RLQ9_OIKDI|nr:Oidioi.mRNA.OKI2018_I69.PAR.g8947.t1.cds [Oikopleura dioica]
MRSRGPIPEPASLTASPPPQERKKIVFIITEETSFSVETQQEKEEDHENRESQKHQPPRRVSRAASWKKPRKRPAEIDYNPSTRWLLAPNHATSTLQSAHTERTKSQTRTLSDLTPSRKLSVESKLTNDTVYTDRPTFGRKMNQRLNIFSASFQKRFGASSHSSGSERVGSPLSARRRRARSRQTSYKWLYLVAFLLFIFLLVIILLLLIR